MDNLTTLDNHSNPKKIKHREPRSKILVAYRGPVQRHILIPEVQWNNPELISRYIMKLHFEMYALKIKPKYVNWMVCETRCLYIANRESSGANPLYKVRIEHDNWATVNG